MPEIYSRGRTLFSITGVDPQDRSWIPDINQVLVGVSSLIEDVHMVVISCSKDTLKTSVIDVYGCIPGRDLYSLLRNIKSHNKIFHLKPEGERDYLTMSAALRRTHCLHHFMLAKD